MQAIFQFYYPSADVQHTIDDFLFIALTRVACQELLDGFDWLCRNIGVPLAPEKTTKPATWVVLLGIMLD